MYEIYADNVCIFSDSSPDVSLKCINPKLTLAASAAGSLEITLPVTNAGYKTVQRITSTIYVKRDGVEIWRGRPLTESIDFFNSRVLTCEGALSYLNDTILYLQEKKAPGTVIEDILNKHNFEEDSQHVVHNRVPANRQIVKGTVGLTDESISVDAQYIRTLEALNNLQSTYGGIFRTRIDNGSIVLDWLADYPAVTGDEQAIEFGKNLLDFSRGFDNTEFATAVWVRGKDEDRSYTPDYDPDGDDSNNGYEIVNGGGTVSVPHAVLVVNAVAEQTYGRIETVVRYDDLTTDQELATEGAKFLQQIQFQNLVLDLTAVDLHLLNPSIKAFELLERVHVTSWAHGLDDTFAVLGITIPLDNPSRTTYTLGSPSVAYKRRVKTLTEITQDEAETAQEDIERTAQQAHDYTTNQVTDARNDLTAKMNAGTRGYITIDYSATSGSEGTDGIYITDEKLPVEDGMTIAARLAAAGVTSYWQWTADGLGYREHSEDPITGQGSWSYLIAITNDGQINASMITTGLLLAQYIKLYGDLSVYPDANTAVASGYLGYGTGHDSTDTTNGIHMFVNRSGGGVNEVIVTNAGARMTTGDNHVYVTPAGITLKADLIDLGVLDVSNDANSSAVRCSATFLLSDVNVGATLTDLGTRVTTAEGKITTAEGKISALEGAVSGINGQITALWAAVHRLEPEEPDFDPEE